MSELTDNELRVTKAAKEHSNLATDREKAGKLCWIQHPFITRYINQQISGNPDIDWLTWFKQKYVKNPFNYGLSLGCGTGVVEREVIEKNICHRFDGIDITQESIDIAIHSAKENNLEDKLNYSVQDLNHVQLESQKYDFILMSHSLHHVERLEHVLMQIQKSLKSDGLFLLSEYIGPSQFQFTDEQLNRMNELLETIPKEYKRDLSRNDAISYKGPVIRPTREFMTQFDPSEAIRSDEIIPVLRKYFNILEKKDYGGTILQFLLADIAGNFDEKNEPDKLWLEKFCTLEQQWIQEGKLTSDFAVMVAKPIANKSILTNIAVKLGLKIF